MTPPRWIETSDAPPSSRSTPLAWLFRDTDAAVQSFAARAPVLPADLRDAAAARAGGGAPRLLRRRVLRALVAQALGVHPAEPAFTRDTAGAVRLEGAAGLFVSTAGRAGWSAVAVSSAPVGVDVEESDALPPNELRDWIAGEAWAKLTGGGLGTAQAPGRRPSASFRIDGPVTACLLSGR